MGFKFKVIFISTAWHHKSSVLWKASAHKSCKKKPIDVGCKKTHIKITDHMQSIKISLLVTVWQKVKELFHLANDCSRLTKTSSVLDLNLITFVLLNLNVAFSKVSVKHLTSMFFFVVFFFFYYYYLSQLKKKNAKNKISLWHLFEFSLVFVGTLWAVYRVT